MNNLCLRNLFGDAPQTCVTMDVDATVTNLPSHEVIVSKFKGGQEILQVFTTAALHSMLMNETNEGIILLVQLQLGLAMGCVVFEVLVEVSSRSP